MSYNQHHSHCGSLREKAGRPLEMRDSSILDRAASSRRSRTHLPAVKHDAKMTPWGTEPTSNDDDAAGISMADNVVASSSSPSNPTHHKTRYANHYQNEERTDQGGYTVPDVTPSHNHFQNKETTQPKMRLQMSSSRINASHMSGWAVATDQCNITSTSTSTSTACATPSAAPVGTDAAPTTTSSTTTTAAAGLAAGAPSEHCATRKMATSRINASHGLFFQEPGALKVQSLRPGTPRCNRPPTSMMAQSPMRTPNNNENGHFVFDDSSTNQQQQRSVARSTPAPAFEEPVRRGPVHQPWNGYTDAKSKFGGKIDKTAFW